MIVIMCGRMKAGKDTCGDYLVEHYGFEKLRFSAPVPVGKRIRAHFKLAKIEERKPGQWLSHWDVTVEVEDQDAPAIRAHWLTLFIVGA